MIAPSLRAFISGATMLIIQLLATMLLVRILLNGSSDDVELAAVKRVRGGVADQDVDLAERLALSSISRCRSSFERCWRRPRRGARRACR